MTVVVSCETAAALIAEGAICLDADTGVVTREGQAISLDSINIDGVAPVLVCGSTDVVNAAASDLEAVGLPAWRVSGVDGHPRCCRHGGEPASPTPFRLH